MAFSDGIKDFFGISPVRTVIDCPTRFSIDQKTIDGRLTLVGLRDSELTEVKMEVVEEWTEDDAYHHRQEHRKVRGTDLLLNQKMFLAKDQEISCDFSVPFKLSWHLSDELKMNDGVVGTVSKAASLLDLDSLSKEDGLLGGVGKVASFLLSEDEDEADRSYSIAAVINRKPNPMHQRRLIRIDWGPLKRDHGQS